MKINVTNIFENILLLEGMPLAELYAKFYRDKVDNIDDFKYLNSLDPTSAEDNKGKYLDFLVKIYNKEYNRDIEILKDESESIKKHLAAFSKLSGKDIGTVKDLGELEKLAADVKSRSDVKKDAEKIYDKHNWTVIVPKSEAAAKLYGKNTKWCTSAIDNCKFSDYNIDGKIYILIHKYGEATEKYQFYFTSREFKNERNNNLTDDELNIIPSDLIETILKYDVKDSVDAHKDSKLADNITFLLRAGYDVSKLPILHEYEVYKLILLSNIGNIGIFKSVIDAIKGDINVVDEDGNNILLAIGGSLDEATLNATLKYMTPEIINAQAKTDKMTGLYKILDDTIYYSPPLALRMATILLEAGADKSVNTIVRNGTNGITPLWIACDEFNQHYKGGSGVTEMREIIALLLKYGADPDINKTTQIAYNKYLENDKG